MPEYLEHLDKTILLFINSLNSPLFDNIMWFISGTFSWIPLYAILLYYAIRNNKKSWWLVIIAVALAVTIADQVSVHLFKEVFKRYRPSHNIELKGMLHHVNNYRGGQYGFVSSHAANAFAIAGFFAFLFNSRNITLFLLLWAAIVSYSRVYLGVHYPSDIFCGAVLGLNVAFICYFIFMKMRWVVYSGSNSMLHPE